MRISNFFLWQLAYTEIYVTETLWPDFREREFVAGARLLPAAAAPLRPHAGAGRARARSVPRRAEAPATARRARRRMLQTRLATAAVAIPALWLFIVYASPASFAGFIIVVTAIGAVGVLRDGVSRAHAGARRRHRRSGLLVAAGVATRDRTSWGAAASLAVVLGLAFPLAAPRRRSTPP